MKMKRVTHTYTFLFQSRLSRSVLCGIVLMSLSLCVLCAEAAEGGKLLFLGLFTTGG